MMGDRFGVAVHRQSELLYCRSEFVRRKSQLRSFRFDNRSTSNRAIMSGT
jgi:hypothetical protein